MKLGLLFFLLGMIMSYANPNQGRLAGHIDIGPISPVERPGQKERVPPAMYARLTVLVTQPGPHNAHMRSHLLRVVKRLQPNAKGDFSTNLAPGEYELRIESKDPLTTAHPRSIRIEAGKTTRATLKVDTGIR